MLNGCELEFINKYIVNGKKKRIIYEFSNTNKRKDALMRFAHDIEKIINKHNVLYIYNIDNIDIEIKGNVYIISLMKLNGEYCSYEQAIEHLKEQYMPVIIIGDEISIIKTENEDLKENIFVLK